MLIPSIDLMNGKAVQLIQGKEKVLERENPLEIAEEFGRFGEIAVIDLDAAMGKGENEELIRDLCRKASCRVGGGIETVEKAKKLFSYGATKIIIGSKAFLNGDINKKFLIELAAEIGKERIQIAVDAFNGEVVTKAWTSKTGIEVTDAVKMLEPYCGAFLFTVVEKEGKMEGTDISLLKKLKSATKNPITIAGGITTLEDVRQISSTNSEMQLGMAIYTGKLKLEGAFIDSLDWEKSTLIPTVATDESGQVLMMAYSSRESLKKTFETGNVTYFSRSRSELWTKGETSGNYQKFRKIRMDCDRDTIVIEVEQTGNACHLDRYSCFGDRNFSQTQLLNVIKERFENPKPGSYTAKLTDELLREKIMEEAEEVCTAGDRGNKIWEVADLLYFLTVYMAKENITMNEVMNELQRRRRK